jgi:hypothetical protein
LVDLQEDGSPQTEELEEEEGDFDPFVEAQKIAAMLKAECMEASFAIPQLQMSSYNTE